VKRIALSLLIALLIPIQAFSQKTIKYRIPIELLPNIREGGRDVPVRDGGRANTVAINPQFPTERFVASDSGGLFTSIDSGRSWSHVDSLPVIFPQSIVYLDTNTLLVSAKADFKSTNGSGLWRSGDRGIHWEQVPLPGSTGRLSAYEISVDGANIAVATSKGVFLSTDNGANWNYSDPFGPLFEPPAFEPQTVYSVLVMGSHIFAGGPHGIRVNTVPLGAWQWPSSGIVGAVWSIHAFGRSPLPDQAYVAAGGFLYTTADSGTTWLSVTPPQTQVCGGAPFVEAARLNDQMFLYYGTSCKLFRITAPIQGTTVRYDLSVRQELDIERADRPRDLVMRAEEPFMLATNAGIQNTVDGGLHWRFVGGGRDGYNAYQIPELKGQFITSADNHVDLYVPTRDNHFWATDVDANIDASLPIEAYLIDAERRLFVETDTRITWAKCNPCDTRQSGWHFGGETAWSDPAGGTTGPVLIQGERYVENVPAGIELTPNAGDDWHAFAAFPEEARGVPKLARGGHQPIVYQTFKANLTGPPSDGATRLMRIGNGVVLYPAMTGFGGLGTTQTSSAMYPVYGVDSRNALRVIAPDIINGSMKVTCNGSEECNGGEEWYEIPDLTKKITNDGQYLFHADLSDFEAAPFVTAVSFSPDDPQLVLIGTRENGIFMSGDRGKTWSKINNSERVTNVTAFFWVDANTIYVSTYGRGLWKLQNTQFVVQSMFGQLCNGCEVVSEKPFDRGALVFNGRVLGVRTEKGRLLEVFVTNGSSVVFTGDPKDPQEDIAITRSDGKDTGEPLPKGPDGSIATGVVFTSDGTLTGAAFAKSELSLLPPEFDGDYKGSTESPMKGTPYIRLTASAFNGVATAAPQEVFALSGTNFAAGASYEVLVDGAPVEGEITADSSGSLTTRLAAPSESGYHRVEVRTVKEGTAIDGSLLLVTHAN